MHQQAPIIPYHSPLDARVASPTSVGWRHLLWFGLLLGASVAFSLGLACATPFAAFGAVAVLGQILAINAAVFIGLLLLNHLGISAGLIINPSIPLCAQA